MQVGIAFEVMPSSLEEQTQEVKPEAVVESLAGQKAADIMEQLTEAGTVDVIVLGADTVVALGGRVLGKPADEADACAMLRSLQGQTHHVYTGVCLLLNRSDGKRQRIQFHEKTEVTMYRMEDWEIRQYAATGEPLDKAGAYGIQGLGAAYIKGIRGDYNNVVGLPVGRVYQEIKKFLLA